MDRESIQPEMASVSEWNMQTHTIRGTSRAGLGIVQPSVSPGPDRDKRNSRNVSASVSAIIVNYNGGEHLRACLRSLSAQTHSLTNVFVVDNASTDGSLDTIEAGSQCEIIRLDENTGFSSACNRASAITADSEWLLLLNPDAILDPKWLENMLMAAGTYPDCAMFACRLIQNGNRNLLDGAGDVFHVSGAHWRRGHGRVAHRRYKEAEEVFSPCAAAALYKHDAFHQVGGFDESFFCYGEDVDLAFRMRMQGHYCMYVPEAVAYHAGSACTSRRSDFAVYHGHRNLVWVYFKNMPKTLLFLYLPQHLIWNLVSVVWFTLRGQGRMIIRAKWDAIKALPRICHERCKVQSQRKVKMRDLWAAMHRGILQAYFGRH